MQHAIDSALTWLEQQPNVPSAALVATIFLSVYVLRRFFPGAWLWFEHLLGGFVDTLDPGPVLKVLLKLWQAIPGALIGAAVVALQSGLSVRIALVGTLGSLLAAAAHEVMDNYHGDVGGLAKRAPSSAPAVLSLILASSLVLTACALFGSGGAFWPVVAKCVPTPSELLVEVEAVLLAGGDYESGLEHLAEQKTKEAVECAVQAALDTWTAPGAQPATDRSIGVANARAFLAGKTVHR